MVLKACVYKDCENYILDGVASSNFTLFKFPKDEHRRKQWMEFGCVPLNVPETSLYMCSEHFDKKYISNNNRRKLLVGPAVPVIYKAEYTDESASKTDSERVIRTSADNYVIINEAQMNKTDYNDLHSDERFQVESTTKPSDEEDTSDKEQQDIETSNQYSSTSKKQITRKRGRAEEISLAMKRECAEPPSEEEKKQSDEEKLDDESLIDSTQVASFIFKGEVYVQMPKKHYLQEKRIMLSELLLFKSVIEDIKLKLDVLNSVSTLE